MDFLWWSVPIITSPMLIALIATLHVFISHYAVGGGMFLAWELRYAYREKDEEYIAYLHSHAKFFVLITVVLGAITGVGIWFAIGLASPLATEMLINVFVFGWATEWVFFVIELVAAFIFLYCWGKMDRKKHLIIGWIYAIAALMSLIIICGILGFMLHPSAEWMQTTNAGRENPNFFAAFFNSQWLPQSLARAGAALVLASAYVVLHAAVTLREDKSRLRRLIVEHLGQLAIVGIILAVLGVFWAYANLPESAKATLLRSPVMNIFWAVGSAAAAFLFLLMMLLLRNPRWLSPITGLALVGMALVSLSCAEFVREAVRKPYVVYGVIYGNQLRESDSASFRRDGLLHGGYWTNLYVQKNYPYLVNENGTFSLDRTSPEDREALGRMIFMHHCNDCHAETLGYSSLSPRASTRTRAEKLHFIRHLDGMNYNMPPWCGSAQEAELLADYLDKIALKYPVRIPQHPVRKIILPDGTEESPENLRDYFYDDLVNLYEDEFEDEEDDE